MSEKALNQNYETTISTSAEVDERSINQELADVFLKRDRQLIF